MEGTFGPIPGSSCYSIVLLPDDAKFFGKDIEQLVIPNAEDAQLTPESGGGVLTIRISGNCHRLLMSRPSKEDLKTMPGNCFPEMPDEELAALEESHEDALRIRNEMLQGLQRDAAEFHRLEQQLRDLLSLTLYHLEVANYGHALSCARDAEKVCMQMHPLSNQEKGDEL